MPKQESILSKCLRISETAKIYPDYITKNDVEIYYTVLDNTLYIAFGSSESISDWYHNIISVVPHFEKEYMVARGFYFLYINSLEEIITYLNNVLDKKEYSNIIVTGHSQGAALARYYGSYLYNNSFNLVQTIVFGCPKMGCIFFEKEMAKVPGIIIQNKKDPLSYLPWGYANPKNIVWINQGWDFHGICAYRKGISKLDIEI